MSETADKQPRDSRGRYAEKLYRSPRGRMVPASGRNRAERDETRGLLIDLVDMPLEGRSQREVNALLVIGEALVMEVEEDFAQIKREDEQRDRGERKRKTRSYW